MKVISFELNPFAENTLICSSDGEAVLFDPGSSTVDERQQLLDYIESEGLVVKHLLLTHGHIDHILDCKFFSDHFDMRFRLHTEDAPLIEHAIQQGKAFGIEIEPPPTPEPLAVGDEIKFGSVTFDIKHCPGHSPGSLCFIDHDSKQIIAGDVLFSGSIGRTDLWKGSMRDLIESIKMELLTLDDDYTVYPGHGPSTTIGAERNGNPFLR